MAHFRCPEVLDQQSCLCVTRQDDVSFHTDTLSESFDKLCERVDVLNARGCTETGADLSFSAEWCLLHLCALRFYLLSKG